MDSLSFLAKVPFSRGSRCTPARVQMPYQFLLVIGLFLLGTASPHTSALSQALPLPTESALSSNSALVSDWANRVMANDPKVRATAEAALVQGAGRSLPRPSVRTSATSAPQCSALTT